MKFPGFATQIALSVFTLISGVAHAVPLTEALDGTYVIESRDSSPGEILKIHFYRAEVAKHFYLEAGPQSDSPGARCVGRFSVQEDVITGRIDHCLNGVGPSKKTFHIRIDKAATYERLAALILLPNAKPQSLLDLQIELQNAGQYYRAEIDANGYPNGSLSMDKIFRHLAEVIEHAKNYSLSNFPYSQYQWQPPAEDGILRIRSDWFSSSAQPMAGLSASQLQELTAGFRVNFAGFGSESKAGQIRRITLKAFSEMEDLYNRGNAVFMEYDRLLLPQWPDSTGLSRVKIASGISVPRWKGNVGPVQMAYVKYAEAASSAKVDASYIMEEYAHEVGLPALNRCARDVVGDYTNPLVVIHAGTYNPDSSHWNADQLDVVALRIGGKLFHYQNASLAAFRGVKAYVDQNLGPNPKLREAYALADRWCSEKTKSPGQTEYYSFWLPFMECMESRGSTTMTGFSRFQFLPHFTNRDLRDPETPYTGQISIPSGSELQYSHISHVHMGMDLTQPYK